MLLGILRFGWTIFETPEVSSAGKTFGITGWQIGPLALHSSSEEQFGSTRSDIK